MDGIRLDGMGDGMGCDEIGWDEMGRDEMRWDGMGWVLMMIDFDGM